MEKNYKYELRLPGIVAHSDNLGALERLADSADMDFEGKLAWDITNTATGEVISFQTDGLCMTLHNLSKMEIPTVRLYNCVLRHLMDVTGRGMEDVLRNITLRDMRDMMLGGKFAKVRNMGTKTYCELYDILIEYCGDTRVTRMAINENIRLTFGDTPPMEIAAYKADLSGKYFEQHPF